MKSSQIFAAVALSLGLMPVATPLIAPALAESAPVEQAVETASFTVENMTCALCPVTVKAAMEGVEGVRSVVVDFGEKSATVVFAPSVTTPEAIAAASVNAGFPAAVRG